MAARICAHYESLLQIDDLNRIDVELVSGTAELAYRPEAAGLRSADNFLDSARITFSFDGHV
jgi:hypothetical protein